MTQCLYRRRLGSFEGSGTSQPPAESLSCRSSCTAAAASSPSASHSQESLWRQSLNLLLHCNWRFWSPFLERKKVWTSWSHFARDDAFVSSTRFRIIASPTDRVFARTCFCALSRFLFSQLRFSWSHAGKETPFRFLFLLVPLRIHHRVLYLIAKPKVEFCIVIFSLIAFIMDWLTIISCCSSSIRRRRRKRKEEGANASSVSLAVSCSCRSTNNHVSCIDYIGIWSQVRRPCSSISLTAFAYFGAFWCAPFVVCFQKKPEISFLLW